MNIDGLLLHESSFGNNLFWSFFTRWIYFTMLFIFFFFLFPCRCRLALHAKQLLRRIYTVTKAAERLYWSPPYCISRLATNLLKENVNDWAIMKQLWMVAMDFFFFFFATFLTGYKISNTLYIRCWTAHVYFRTAVSVRSPLVAFMTPHRLASTSCGAWIEAARRFSTSGGGVLLCWVMCRFYA